MPQPIFPGLPAEPGDAVVDANSPAPQVPSEASAGAELPAERSKFSRWLASFGLGETQIPLLRPRKPTRHLGGGGL